MKRRLISWAITAEAACIIVIISLTTTSATGAEIEDRGAQAHRPNILGFNVALYNNRFIDDVISPVVYAASSPLFEFSYRNENDVRGHTARVEFGFYGAGLEDFDGNDYFEIPVVDGGVYNYPRSLTNLDGTHFEAEYFYRRRALTFEKGKSSLHLGAGGQVLVEEITGTDYWGAEFSWERTKSWSYDLSFALGAGVERRMRKRDLLLLDLRFTAVSLASRAPAYCVLFSGTEWHLCAAYWDGYGWILIDPQASSGFAIPNRVILGADRDSQNIKMITSPDYLINHLSSIDFEHEEGNHSGFLDLVSIRCLQYPEDILEHYERSDGTSPQGFEPANNIVPNTPTDAEYTCPDIAGLGFSNYPNPFNPVTTFRFIVNQPGMVKITLYSVEGRYIETLYNDYCEKGWKEVSWNSSSMSSGVYLARISTLSGTASKKLVILR